MLSVSSGMVGVCLTTVGLIRVIKLLNKVETLVDDMLAVAVVMFMITALFIFFSVRTRISQAWRGITRTIDVIFCLAIVLVAAAAAILTWDVW